MGLVDFVEALEVVLVRLGEGNNQQGCSDDHLGTGLLELAAHHLGCHLGCNKSKGSPHIGKIEDYDRMIRIILLTTISCTHLDIVHSFQYRVT